MALFNNLVQGALGNYSEKTPEQLTQEYGAYLFDNEEITMGYQLVRDALIFTNHRVIFVDKQGATGKKTAFHSIHLDSIVEVDMETAGTGLDDSEITITYLKNINQRSNNEVHAVHKFEFPKKTDILPLYRYLGNVSMTNRTRINK
ncbi:MULTISPECIES: PH domain-containing protein [Enterococcus]|uniref:Bacterial Pleckstrin homology domain-containing protein n=1 Tax=Enterococcus thailandicus TaxID=417368 RepID=A0A179EU80_ENTTH|nr:MULTISPECIES: PH domain-containing protein [Enterococcus]ASZ07503.1 PH domain-containing protein [Enterococcus thailandicus]MDA3965187.1 PH domain-containing protein [Enterococcus thailandicus]MDK4351159.1 PH domain-containing protein [Enterococcus thailandicus]MDT2733191.1 PH domain-containing protein [Enterococcus thailandicus]MDT2750811.1 PH domain-containing protein [Enterococcus thailandicus]